MVKVSQQYLEVDPYKIIEKGFHKERNEVSESIFSLANEYMGVRGFLEEGTTLPTLIGTYFNGIIEYSLKDTPSAYKGIVKRSHFTINSVNFLKCKISVDGEILDLATSEISDFIRKAQRNAGRVDALEYLLRIIVGIELDLCANQFLHSTVDILNVQIILFKDIADQFTENPIILPNLTRLIHLIKAILHQQHQLVIIRLDRLEL